VITFPELNFLQNGFIKTREKWAGSIAALRTVDAAFDNYTFQEERYFGEINLETILQAFGPNRLVLWSGHGSYLVRDGACLDTEIKVSEREEMTTYADGIKEGWYIICDGTLGLTTAFFRDRCQDMTNSFILLSSCYVMEDANLSDIFLKKGAGAVVGFNNTVSNKYALRMFRRILQVMCKKNPGTKKYYTVSEALNQARERYGDSDPLGDAETVLAGDSNWRLREEDIAGGCELSGIVYQTKREEEVVPGACVYLYDTDLNLLAATTTDAGGRFGFGGLDEKVMGVYVRDGNSTKIRRIELTKDTSLVFHMQEPIDIYGDVWEEGGNGEGVEVRVFVFDKTGDKRLTSVTGKGGSFRITVDGPGFYTISFQKEGYDAVVQHVEVDKEELRVHADMYKSQKQSTPDTPQTSPKITPNPKATEVPKAILSVNQTATPTGKPTPTAKSTTQPTTQPTAVPTTAPTVTPTWEQIPTASPTLSPPSMPTVTPTVTLFPTPTITPTVSPAAI